MNNNELRRKERWVWIVIFSIAVVLPIAMVMLGSWIFGVSLPTLMFCSFLLLFFGGAICFPFSDKQTTHSEGLIVLIVGLTSAIGVLILVFVRLASQGWQFSWR